jgi:peptidoglycan hydrolase CwlO-like protein
MTMSNRNLAVLVVAMVTFAAAMQTAAAQSQRGTSPDPSTALLEEVRALRAELAQLSRTSLRMQLLVARVQLQEQRIQYFDKQRVEIQSKLTAATERAAQAATEIERTQEQIKSLRSAPSAPAGPGQAGQAVDMAQFLRPALDLSLEGSRRDAEAAAKAVEQLRAQEADVMTNLTDEQGRWNEFNARLDELERSLPTR